MGRPFIVNALLSLVAAATIVVIAIVEIHNREPATGLVPTPAATVPSR